MAEAGALLVVDGCEASREDLARDLAGRGFEVVQAVDGAQALAAIAERSFDLVLVDSALPDISGLEVLQAIREDYTFAELPVIIAAARDAEAVSALELGANDFATKPINRATLLARVVNHVKIRRIDRELREAKLVAERASRAKSSFLTNMSHEVRTPLNSVIGFANVLLQNKRGNLTASELTYVQRIAENGMHLLKLINDVLDLSKVESSKIELVIEDVDVTALVEETVAQLDGRPRAEGVDLRAELCPAPVVVRADAHRLRQVLINLVSNAIKFTPAGSVTVRVSPSRIDVVDTGVGIPHDRMSAIFETFEQADSTIGRRYGGTGLGLAISRSLCGLMGFDLIVESIENSGSTFSIVMSRTRVS